VRDLSFRLNDEEGVLLVQLARKAVEVYLKTGKTIEVPETAPEKLKHPSGVFVTINSIKHQEKELTGCIGFPYPTTQLAQAVIESAINAATQDPRFPPMSSDELQHVVFEVSVLTPPQIVRVKDPREYCDRIKVGEDGLIIENGACKGLLLPQVPVEWQWNAEEFLCQCCTKAGLYPDHWLRDGTRVYKFQAIIFEEEQPRGKIRQKSLSDE
jgi:uncharacterized protein (TIGR00296 family)